MRSAGPFTGVTLEVFNDRQAFEARLTTACVRTVDFDDIDTSTSTSAVPFAADRYEMSHGVILTGTDGQYVDETFGWPPGVLVHSAPNLYAPGPPVAPQATETGGFETDVTWTSGGAGAGVAGFGLTYIDADWPSFGASGMVLYDHDDVEIGRDMAVVSADNEAVFRGFVAVDAAGTPVPALFRAHVVNGSEWPERDVDEGVLLDDFAFDVPVAW